MAWHTQDTHGSQQPTVDNDPQSPDAVVLVMIEEAPPLVLFTVVKLQVPSSLNVPASLSAVANTTDHTMKDPTAMHRMTGTKIDEILSLIACGSRQTKVQTTSKRGAMRATDERNNMRPTTRSARHKQWWPGRVWLVGLLNHRPEWEPSKPS